MSINIIFTSRFINVYYVPIEFNDENDPRRVYVYIHAHKRNIYIRHNHKHVHSRMQSRIHTHKRHVSTYRLCQGWRDTIRIHNNITDVGVYTGDIGSGVRFIYIRHGSMQTCSVSERCNIILLYTRDQQYSSICDGNYCDYRDDYNGDRRVLRFRFLFSSIWNFVGMRGVHACNMPGCWCKRDAYTGRVFRSNKPILYVHV